MRDKKLILTLKKRVLTLDNNATAVVVYNIFIINRNIVRVGEWSRIIRR